ncbi:flagellar hook-length control protein FliK [Ignavibacterium sp.]|uniref:flagellar hook-length control protein FliK n=1 Tax=Ignavibacterium sp. TaxID=2651167 RepID=UPI0022020DE3|nr:flagellar hook-length control protein FliK [Ignavibacterium sp.]BDQ02856.1 MAG: hypothetical protein KatS3mg037_1431 [Ignavibacterium sp.]
MLINSLFLSKLFNPKTENQTSETDANGFSYLFSEIIKIKSENEESNFIPENIGGTLLDHKTIFLSNSSPLENKTHGKLSSSVKVIEELYKLFNSANGETKVESESLILDLNKITTDKNQFLKSIETLIKNILTETNNQNQEVEIRYVSKNLVETKKVTKENLSQFSEYLSKLIDGNQSFSFVIGANGKQILFDVENLIATSEQESKVQLDNKTETSTVKNFVSTESAELKAGEEIKSMSGEKENHSVKNSSDEVRLFNNDKDQNLKTSVNTDRTNNEEINSANKTPEQELLNTINKKTIETVKPKLSGKLLSELSSENYKTHNNSSINTKNLFTETNVKYDNTLENKVSNQTERLENVNVTSRQHQDKETSGLTSTHAKSVHQEQNITVEKELKSESPVIKQQGEIPEHKFEDIREVKIVIKEKSQRVYPKDENQITGKILHDKKLSDTNQSGQLSSNLTVQNFSKMKSGNLFKSITNNVSQLSEKDLPTIISSQTDEPRISRAGLPLIADYQDWDLVFEKSLSQIKNNFEDKNSFVKPTTDKEVIQDQNQKSSINNFQNKVKLNLEDSSSQNHLGKTTEKIKTDSEQDINEFSEKTASKENVLQLKFSGEKKIVSVIDNTSEQPIQNANEVTNKNISQHSITNEKVSENIQTNKSANEIKFESHKTVIEPDIKLKNADTKNEEHFENQNKQEKSPSSVAANKVNDEDNILNDKTFKSELIDSSKGSIPLDNKPHLLNNKTIIEHFIKSPVESKTLEKFLQILDKQEVIQKSEIVNYSKQNHSVEIKLSPKELGSIKILLDTNDNNVSAKIEVGNEQTKSIVVNNLPQLRETMSQQGVNLNNVNVTVSSEEQRNPEQTKQKSKKKSQVDNPKVEIAEEKKTVRNLGYNTYEYLV